MMFTKEEIDLIMTSVINSPNSLSRELGDRLYKFLSDGVKSNNKSVPANLGFVELTDYHGNKVLLNKSTIQKVYIDTNGICKLYMVDFENSIALSGSYEEIKKKLMEV